MQHYYIIPYYVLVHLGKWDDILKLPQPGGSLQYPVAIWHYARGMALAAKDNTEAAQLELDTVKQFAANTDLALQKVWDVNSVTDLIAIAAYTLESEIALHHKDYDTAIGLLKKSSGNRGQSYVPGAA